VNIPSSVAAPAPDAGPKVEYHGNVRIITFTPGGPERFGDVLGGKLQGLTEELGLCHLLLDFSCIERITSVELGTLVNLHKQLKSSGGRLTLFNLNLSVFEVFAVTRLETLIDICR
jgi:anti-anti-sigma factor